MWDDARIYDLETVGDDDDVPYWQSLIARHRPAGVLDLACGTGRLTLPIARAGRALRLDFTVLGLDRSAPFLARARERLADAAPDVRDAVRFVDGDMRSFDLGQTFDLVILGFNSFAYLHTVEDQLACLRAVRRHLAPGGRFALDLLVPLLTFLAEAQVSPPVIRQELDHPVPDQGIARFLRSCADRYDAETQTIASTYFYELYHVDGRQERFTKDLAWHMYFTRELSLLLHLSGLAPVERHGAYDGTPFSKRSKQYLWIMEAV